MSDRAGAVDGGFWSGMDETAAIRGSRAVVNAIDDSLYRLDADGRFVAVNDVFVETTGYSREKLLGTHISLVLGDADIADIDREVSTQLESETQEDITTFEVAFQSADGDQIPVELRINPLIADGERQGIVGIARDITDQHRRADQLRQLNEAVREWLEGTSREGVADQACQHLRDILDLEINGVFLYDSVTRELEPAAWTDRAETLFGGIPTFAEGDGIAWQVFDSGEPEIYSDVTATSAVYNPDTPARSEIVLPIGDHGIVIIGSEAENAFDDTDLMLAKVVASSLEVTFDRIQYERHLEQERDLIGRILETAPVGTLVVDADREITRINERATDILRIDDPETYSPSDTLLYDEDGTQLPVDERPFARVFATGEPMYDRVLQIERPDGDRRWLSVNAAPLTSEDGGITRIVTTFEDVTELTERKRELESELREILGRVTDAFYAVDKEFNFTHVNERTEELIGYSEAEMLGENLLDIFPKATETVIWEDFHTAMETQEPQHHELYYEPLGFWIEETVYPSETGLSVYFRDITERKERERALQEERDLIERIVETSPIGITTLDADGTFDLVNDRTEEILGYTASEICDYGRQVERLDPITPDEERLSPGETPTYRVFENGETVHDVEIGLQRPDGERVWVSVSGTPMRDDGTITGAVITFADITDRIEYERKLEESNERLEQFAYSASHDLQEPLRMVTSYLQLLEKRYADAFDEDGEEFLEYAVDGAERMREMIDGLLEYSRIETRGDPFEPVDLDAVLDEVLADLQLRTEESDAEITADDLPRVAGDASQLRQVFQNMLSNAITYSGDGPPRVHVGTERRGGEWVISVADEGIGIDPEDQDRIFTIFDRLHSREEYEGTGIGLALCRRIVERHGGEIWVDSEPGEGTTFSFTLPPA